MKKRTLRLMYDQAEPWPCIGLVFFSTRLGRFSGAEAGRDHRSGRSSRWRKKHHSQASREVLPASGRRDLTGRAAAEELQGSISARQGNSTRVCFFWRHTIVRIKPDYDVS